MKFSRPYIWLIFILGGFIASFSCSEKPECRGDQDCREKYQNPHFYCYLQKCYNYNPLDEKGQDGGSIPEKPREKSSTQEKTIIPEKRSVEPSIETISENIPERKPEVKLGLPLFSPCVRNPKAPSEQRCQHGLICLKADLTHSFCFQDCTTNASICLKNTDGRTDCRQVAWNEKGKAVFTCVKTVGKGEGCDPKTSTYCRKNPVNNLSCIKGRCVPSKLCQQAGCSCSLKKNPPVECDIEKQLVCSKLGQCVNIIQVYEDEVCDYNARPPRICAPGLICVNFGHADWGVPRICKKKCLISNPLTTCAYRKGFVCRKLSGGTGVCFNEKCKTHEDCPIKYPAHYCGGTKTTHYCLPLPAEGKVGFGGLCNNNKPSMRCQHPYYCLSTRKDGLGYCSLQCTTTEQCKIHHKTATCTIRQQTTGVSFCGWSCNSCPKDLPYLKCHSANNLCLP